MREAGGPKALWEKTGIPVRTLQNFVSERNPVQPSPADLALICYATGTPIEALLGMIPSGKTPELAHGRDSVPIRMAEVRASAGHGSLVVDDDGSLFMDIPRAILEAAGLRPQQARIMRISGSSMEPTISDSDIVLVDVSPDGRDMISDGRIYVFSVADQVFVKRLRRASQGVFARSDNKDLFPEDELIPRDEPLSIFGRVVWSGRRH